MAFDLDQLETLLEEMEPAEIEARFGTELGPAGRAMLRHFSDMDQTLAAVKERVNPPDILPVPRKRAWVWALPLAAVFLAGFFGLYIFRIGEDPLRRQETVGSVTFPQSRPLVVPQEEARLADEMAPPNRRADRGHSMPTVVDPEVAPTSSPGSVEESTVVPILPTKPEREPGSIARPVASKPSPKKVSRNRSITTTAPPKDSAQSVEKESGVDGMEVREDLELAVTSVAMESTPKATENEELSRTLDRLVIADEASADSIDSLAEAPAQSSANVIEAKKKGDRSVARSGEGNLSPEGKHPVTKPGLPNSNSLKLVKAKGPVASWIIRFQDFLGQPGTASGERLFTPEASIQWSPISSRQLVREAWLKAYLDKVSQVDAGWLAGGVRAEVISYQATSDAELTLALVRWWQVFRPETAEEVSNPPATRSGYLEVTLNRAGRCVHMGER